MSSGPTPGPWRVDGRKGICKHDIVGPNGEDIAYVNPSDGADEPEMYPVAANERLIAAAPDLLALLHWLNRKGGLGLDVHARIDAAIAKAEGR